MLHVVASEHFKVRLAVSEESFNVVMGTLEVLGLLHEQRFDVAHGEWTIVGIRPGGSC